MRACIVCGARMASQRLRPQRCRPCHFAHVRAGLRAAALARMDSLSVPVGACREWVGKFDRDGYGLVSAFGGSQRAPRVAYILANGSIPAGLVVMHSCDNRKCVNADHLSVGTHAENIADRHQKGRDFRGPRDPRHIRRGDASSRHVLTEALVRDIHRRIAAGETHLAIATSLGVSKSTITAVNRGQNWRHVEVAA